MGVTVRVLDDVAEGVAVTVGVTECEGVTVLEVVAVSVADRDTVTVREEVMLTVGDIDVVAVNVAVTLDVLLVVGVTVTVWEMVGVADGDDWTKAYTLLSPEPT